MKCFICTVVQSRDTDADIDNHAPKHSNMLSNIHESVEIPEK